MPAVDDDTSDAERDDVDARARDEGVDDRAGAACLMTMSRSTLTETERARLVMRRRIEAETARAREAWDATTRAARRAREAVEARARARERAEEKARVVEAEERARESAAREAEERARESAARSEEEEVETNAGWIAMWHHALGCETNACVVLHCARAKADATHIRACEDERCARYGAAGKCQKLRDAWESHLTHRFDECLTCAKVCKLVRENRAMFTISPERRRAAAAAPTTTAPTAREGEHENAAPAPTTAPTGSETTAPVDETVDVDANRSVIARANVDDENENDDDEEAMSDITRGPTHESLEEEEEEIQCTQTQEHDDAYLEEIQCTQTHTESHELVQSSAQDLIIIDGSDDERDEDAERENAGDDDDDGSARKKPKLSHSNYTMAQVTSMVCSYAADEGKDLEEIFSHIRQCAAERDRNRVQRDRRRLEMRASRLG